MSSKKPTVCECTPWKIVRKPGSDYCPDLIKCAYVQTRLKIRQLQALPFRSFQMQLPAQSGDGKQLETVALEVLQAPDLSQVGDGTGTVIWGGSINFMNCCAKLCRDSNSLLFAGRRVIEIGAGSGLCSMAAALCGADVIATDKDIRLARSNTDRMPQSGTAAGAAAGAAAGSGTAAAAAKAVSGSVRCVPHSWGVDLGELDALLPCDVLVMSDVLYFSDYFGSLTKTLDYIMQFGVGAAASASASSAASTGSAASGSAGSATASAAASESKQEAGRAGSAAGAVGKGRDLGPVVVISHKCRDPDVDSRFFMTASERYRVFRVSRALFAPPASAVQVLLDELRATMDQDERDRQAVIGRCARTLADEPASPSLTSASASASAGSTASLELRATAPGAGDSKASSTASGAETKAVETKGDSKSAEAATLASGAASAVPIDTLDPDLCMYVLLRGDGRDWDPLADADDRVVRGSVARQRAARRVDKGSATAAAASASATAASGAGAGAVESKAPARSDDSGFDSDDDEAAAAAAAAKARAEDRASFESHWLLRHLAPHLTECTHSWDPQPEAFGNVGGGGDGDSDDDAATAGTSAAAAAPAAASAGASTAGTGAGASADASADSGVTAADEDGLTSWSYNPMMFQHWSAWISR